MQCVRDSQMPANSSFLQSWLEPLLGRWLYADSALWTVVGFLGAAIFGSRFLLQWLQSEKEKKLVVPWYFWHLSFWGSVLNLLYFLHLDKAPLILGNCFLPFLYGRNILFLRAGGEKGRGRLVFAAVAVLTVLGFAMSAFVGGESDGPKVKVMDDLNAIQAELKRHQQEKGMPVTGSTREILRTLFGEGKGQAGTIAATRLTPDGDLLDPWGHPYRITSFEGFSLIRSAGPNGIFDDGDDEKRDDILLESRGE